MTAFQSTKVEGQTDRAVPDVPQLVPVVNALVREMGSDRSRLLDIALAVHERYGHVSPGAMSAIANALGIHTVEVEDAISFYAFLNREPEGRFHIRLARTAVSMMKGAAAVAEAFIEATGAPMGGTSPDGQFSLEWTSDTGMGDQEPAALINGTVLTDLTPADVPAVVAALQAQRSNVPHPLFPGPLPKAEIHPSLVQPGPVLFGEGGAPGDGIRAALAMAPESVVETISQSKLRGRGGAGFPTALKWKLTREAQGDERVVICNADEGEPGTFKDRVLLAMAPDLVFDGMTIGAHALGARTGIVYLRAEYGYLREDLVQVLQRRREQGLLGKNICGREGFDFDIRIQMGAGSYVCGEETSLIESAEGKRGAPRDRPPFPVERGYHQHPTAVDNVETFACAARILEQGADWFAGHGTAHSTGTKLLSISGDCARPGVYEVDFGITIAEILRLAGAEDAKFVQVGGPSGQCIGPAEYGRHIGAREDLCTGGSIIVFGPERDILDTVRQHMEFFVEESCGWCTPCRVGTTLLKLQLDKIIAGRGTSTDTEAMAALADTVMRTSRCGLGQSAPQPVLSTLRNFPEVYDARLQPDPFIPRVSLEEALAEAVHVQGRQPSAEEE